MSKLTWDRVYSEIPCEVTVNSNGHIITLRASYQSSSHPKIEGGSMNGPYYLDHVHFHWDSTGHKGSEHQVNGKAYPMEMHAVHAKPNMKLEQAAKLPDGIVVAYISEIEQMPHMALKYVQEVFELLEMDLDTPQPLRNMFPLHAGGVLLHRLCNVQGIPDDAPLYRISDLDHFFIHD